MAKGKQYELLFQLTARLGPNFSQSFKTASNTMKLLQGDLKSASQKIKDVAAYQKQQKAMENSRQRAVELQQEYDRLAAEVGDVDNATGKQKKALDKSAQALAKAKDAAADETARLDEMGDALRQAGVNTDNLSRDTEELRQQYERLQSTQQKVQQISQLQDANRAKIATSKAQLAGVVGAAAAAGAAIYNGPVKKAAEFQEQMSTVKALMGGIGKGELPAITKAANEMGLNFKEGSNGSETAMNILAAKAKEMGATTKFTAKEAGDAMEYMAVAGWNAQEVLGGVAGIMHLAAAGGTELGQTSDIVTDSIENFGLTAADASHFADVMAQTMRKSNTDILKLGESYKYVSPVAKAMGYSAEDINVALGLMANSGIKASSGGTALRTLLTNMAKPTEKMAAAMADLDVSLDDGNGNMKSFHDVMVDLRKGFGSLKIPEEEFQERLSSLNVALEGGGITQKKYDKAVMGLMEKAYGAEGAIKAQTAATLAGKEGMSGLLAMVNASDESFNQLTYDINHAQGAAEEMAKTKLDNYAGQVVLFESAFDGLQTEIGLMFLPSLTKAVKKITEITSAANEFVNKNQETVKMVAKIAAGLAGLKAGGLVAKIGFLHLQNGFLGIRKAFTIIKGVGLSRYISTLTNGFGGLAGAAKGIMSYFKGIGSAAGGVASAFGNIFANSSIFSKLGGVMKNAGLKMMGLMLKPFSMFGTKLSGMLANAAGIIARSPIGAIGTVIGKGFGKITAFIAPVANAVKTLLGPLGKLATSVFGPLGGIVGKVLPVVGVVTAIITAVQLVKSHLQEIRGFIQKTFGDGALAIFDKVVAVIANIGDTIRNVFSDGNIGAARNKIQEIFGGRGVKVFDTLVKTLGTVQGVVANVIQFITDNVVPIAERVLSVVATDVIPGIINGIQAAAPVIMQIIQEIAGFFAQMVPVIGSFAAGLMPVIGQIVSFIQANVLPVVSSIFSFIVSTVLPAILSGVQQLGSIVITVLTAVLPVVQTVFTTIWNVIQPIMQMILQVVQAVLPSVFSVFQSVFTAIGGVVSAFQQVLSGIIQFISGVFTGNWTAAWNGVKAIFSGVWEAIKSIASGAIDAISSAVNGVIDGISKVKETIGGVGRKVAKAVHIPGFAGGTSSTPDTFIAGEDGPELITDAPGMKVYTAAQTRLIMGRAAQAVQAAGAGMQVQDAHTSAGMGRALAMNAPGMKVYTAAQAADAGMQVQDAYTSAGMGRAPAGAGTVTVQVTSSPQITVTGNGDAAGIKEQLKEYDAGLMEKIQAAVAAALREEREQEERVAYV